jgi:hypothetical protein
MVKGEPTSKNKRGQWTDDQMELAVDEVRNKESKGSSGYFFSSLGDIVTKLQDGGMVKMTPGMGWFRRTLTSELEE